MPFTNQDIININNLQIQTKIGVHAWEQQVNQPVILDIAIATKLPTSDQLCDTIDYQKLHTSILNLAAKQSFQLLESLVFAIEQLITQNFANVFAVQIAAKKPFALPNVTDVGVCIERTYSSCETAQ